MNLKTLKDMELFYIEEFKPGKIPEEKIPYHKGVIERKLPQEPSEFRGRSSKQECSLKLADVEDLKQLAIKRYKYWEEITLTTPGAIQSYGRMNELKDFFNIIEEDLMTNDEINAREHGEKANN